MKKIIVLIVICCISYLSVFAQEQLTKKDLKGIKIEKNDFSDVTFYTSNKTGLYVAVNKHGVSLQWTLKCTALDAIIIKDITIKVDGEFYPIPVDNDRRKEYDTRPVSATYFHSETTNYVDDFLYAVINKIINSKSKVLIRFNVFSSGETTQIDGDIHPKNIEDMRKMVNIYSKLKTK
jgi:hypothetical protein